MSNTRIPGEEYPAVPGAPGPKPSDPVPHKPDLSAPFKIDSTLPTQNSRTGYVLDYQLELHQPRTASSGSALDPPFFRMRLVDTPDGESNPEEYILVRVQTAKTMDRNSSGEPLTVSYGNVEQAMVATVKDALLHTKKIKVGWFNEGGTDESTGRKILLLVGMAR